MTNTKKTVITVPSAPTPVTASILMAYLETMADSFPIEDQPIMINGELVTNLKLEDSRVVLMTYKDMLNENPPCNNHIPVQHRDGKAPWCAECGLTADWENPNG